MCKFKLFSLFFLQQYKKLYISKQNTPNYLKSFFKNDEIIIIRDLPMVEFDITKDLVVSTNQYDRGKDDYVIVQSCKRKQKNRQYVERKKET